MPALSAPLALDKEAPPPSPSPAPPPMNRVRPPARSSKNLYREFREKLKAGDDFKGDQDEPKEETPPETRRNFRDYLAFLKPMHGAIAVVMVLALATTVLDMLIPLGTGLIVDRILQNTGLATPEKARLLGQAAAVLIGAILLARGLDALRDYRTHRVNTRSVSRLRQRVMRHVLELPLATLHRLQIGRMVSRVTGDVEAITGVLQMAFISPSVAVLRLIIALVIVLSWNWRLGMVLVALLIPIGFISYLWVKPLRRMWRAYYITRSKVDGRLHETFNGLRVVRSFQRETAEARRQQVGNHSVLRTFLHGVRVNAAVNVFWSLLIPVTGVAVLWYGGVLLLNGQASLGQILAFSGYSGMLMWPIFLIANSLSEVQRGVAAIDRVFELLRAEPETDDSPDAVEAPAKVEELRLDDVSFGYEADKPVLKNISLTVPKGATVALVGHSGAGKSTFADLVARFYKPTGGRLLVNGQDAAGIKLHSYRRLLGMVPQETFLFDGTVAENIAYASRDVSLEQIEAAAKAANAHEFIMELPDGYQSRIGERGTKLSGGQRQRLSIARALLYNPEILIFDEATSNLDTESEQVIQESMVTLCEGRMTFLIAHRLSTVRHADIIVVLDHGEMVEHGTHEALMAKRGRYFEMVRRQNGQVG